MSSFSFLHPIVDNDQLSGDGTIANPLTLASDYVGSKTITTNTTYYVATAGNDSTGDGSSGNPWLTLSKAVSVVREYRIKSGVTVTITLGDGTFTETSSVQNLPSGVVITGTNVLSRSVTSIQSSSGAAGAYSIIVNMDSIADITTDDFVAITGASGGTTPEYVEGIWPITNVDAVNTRITVSSSHTIGVPSGAVSATAKIYKTNLYFTGCHGLNNTPITIQNLCLRGDNTALMSGVLVSEGKISLTNIGIRYFGDHGVVARYCGSVSATDLTVSSNGTFGIFTEFSASISAQASVSGNTSDGIVSRISGSLTVYGVISGNGGNGVAAEYAGNISTSATIIGNTSNAIFAQRYGYVYAGSASITGSLSPSANVQGNEFGYIDV